MLRAQGHSVPVKAAGGSLFNIRIELRHNSACNGVNLKTVAVVFCGTVYRGVLVRDGWSAKWEGIWTTSKVKEWANKFKDATVELRSDWRDRRKNMDEYFNSFPASEKLRNYMIMSKSSILVEEEPEHHGEEPVFRVNPVGLKQLGFAKALDPYSAYQELSMWIGGVLGGTSPEIVTIKDDKVLIENHGFDKVTSFRGPRIA